MPLMAIYFTFIQEAVMSSYRKFFLVMVIGICFTGFMNAQENPSEMFSELFDKYLKSEYKYIQLNSPLDNGAGMFIFDINNKFSNDIFREIRVLGSMGQTVYLVYKKDGEDIWYFQKEALFYEEPFKLKNAETIFTYFKFIDGLPWAFNDDTGEYDIQADTDRYRAVTDVRTLATLIEIVETNTI